jgi:hypothetical protein
MIHIKETSFVYHGKRRLLDFCLMNVFEKRKPAWTAAPSPWAFHPPAFRAGRSIEVSLCPVCVVAGSGAKPIITVGVLAHLPEQGHGVPLCGLGIQGMYTGFRLFGCQGSSGFSSLIHWTFFEIF